MPTLSSNLRKERNKEGREGGKEGRKEGRKEREKEKVFQPLHQASFYSYKQCMMVTISLLCLF
jgi:hypothetical protein